MPAHGIPDARVQAVLDRLHREARKDFSRVLPRALPALFGALLSGRPVTEAIAPHLSDAYIPVSREQGVFLYKMARAISAETIVEFGTSFGISSLYLASAVRDNGGGRFIGTEKEPHKARAARQHLAEAGLDMTAEVREGDARSTLADFAGPIDMVLLDGWKDLYLPMLHLLKPKLRPGAVVMADNIFTFRKALKPYVTYVQSGKNGFMSQTLKLGDGFEFSVFVG